MVVLVVVVVIVRSANIDLDVGAFSNANDLTRLPKQLDMTTSFHGPTAPTTAAGYTLGDYNSEARATTKGGRGVVSPHQFSIKSLGP